MNSTEKLCRFCLRHVKDTYFNDLGELCDILNALNLKVNMDISKEPVLCVDCIENLRKLFSFKAKCVQSEDFLIPFINSHVNKKIDLQQVYLEINDSKSLGDKKVCRFCMCDTVINSSLELNTIIEFMLPTMYLQEFFPEMDMNLVREPIICKTCYKFLEDHLTFTRKCMNIEERIQQYIKVEGTNAEGKIDLNGVKQFMAKEIVKKETEDGDTFKQEIQHDEIVEDVPSKIDLKMECYIEIEDCQLEIKSENIDLKPIANTPGRILDIASAESSENYNNHFVIEKSIKCHSSAVTMHKCAVEERLYKSKRKGALIRHKLIRKDPSEAAMLKCQAEGCSYETKNKGSFFRHKLIHKDPSEVTMHKCKIKGCSFKTKYKDSLIKHKLIHKDISEVMMYKCEFEGCLYETKNKNYLYSHKFIHKDVSEEMYKCGFEGCVYESKRKRYLVGHMLKHKDPSQITMHKCEAGGCTYQAKRKRSLIKHHKLIHKGVSILDIASAESSETYNKHFVIEKSIKCHSSAVTMHKCAVEGRLYNTKHKGALIRDKLIHKDPSEVTMHKCKIKGCSFKTKYKNSLIKHKLIHKDKSEVTMYKCEFEGCLYETKHKDYLYNHRFSHKDVSEEMMYKCGFEGCVYEAKRKRYLVRHMLKHKDPSQITMYKCEAEGCSYQAKRKSTLIKHHELIHKGVLYQKE